MVKRRTGLDPLAYMGVEPSTPSQFIQDNRNPTTNDYDNFNLMAVWLNTSTFQVWMLVSKANFIATWREFTNDIGNLNTLTGDVGGPVPPTANNIDIEGSGAYLFTGNPGTSTLTLSDDGSVATTYDADTGSAIPAGNILNVIGASGIETTGLGNTLTIGIGSNEFVKTLTGNSGGAVGPDISDNINIVGSGGITVVGNPGTNTLTISGAGVGTNVKLTKFTANGTFTKDPDSVYITLIMWNGGNGGGSGKQGPSTNATGGGGGAGGSILFGTFFSNLFDVTETVTIGAGGLGGASQINPDTLGIDGSIGGFSSVGNLFPGFDNSGSEPYGQGNGAAGLRQLIVLQDTTNGAFNGGGQGTVVGGSDADQPLSSTINQQLVCSGGGGGGGADSGAERMGGNSGSIYTFNTSLSNPKPAGQLLQVGAAGGVESGIIDGEDGVDFVSIAGGRIIGATGGGGGGGQHVGLSAGSGGNGGVPNAGGGGGGGSLNGTASGSGGDGGRGEIWIYETLGVLS